MLRNKTKKSEDGNEKFSAVGFLRSTIILSVFSIFGKVLGAVFKLPLASIVGAEGLGLYQLAFPIFVLLFTLASSGVSTAITIKIAECNNNNFAKMGLRWCAFSSVVLAGLVCGFAKTIARVQGNPEIETIYYFVALAVVGVSLLNGLKAILRGRGQNVSFAVSETIEQVVKVGLALLLAHVLVNSGLTSAISGVFVAIFLSTVVASFFCVVRIVKMPAVQLVQTPVVANSKNKSVDKCSKREFIKMSWLSTLGLIVVPLFQFFDSVIVVNLLQQGGLSVSASTSLLGLAHGAVATLINLPSVAVLSLEFVLLPALVKNSNQAMVGRSVKHSLFLTFVICSPFVFLYLFFPEQIITILYGASLSGTEINISVWLMRIGAIQLVFSGVLQVLVVTLQGMKNLVYPPIILTIGGLVKVLVLCILVPQIGIYGSGLACVAFALITVLLAMIILKIKRVNCSTPWVVVPIMVAFVCVIIMRLIYNISLRAIPSVLSLVLCGVIGSAIYFVVIAGVFKLYTKRVERDE